MKLSKLFLSLVCFSLLLNACKPKEEEPKSEVITNNEYVNTWMMSTLSYYYYWNTKLPSKSDKTMDPEAYFESIMYWYDPVTAPDGDRFSWIEKDYTKLISSLNGVVSNEIGFDMTIYYKDDTHSNLIAQVNYVKKETPAETSGIKRGMLFDRVNGSVLTLANYRDLLTITTADVTLGFVEPVYNDQGFVTNYVNTTVKTLQTVTDYSENPVYMDTIFTTSNHKIGYFVYHFFSPDNGSSDFSYDLDMNDVFDRFKTAGITDLILDLRYNSGGSTSSARLLGSELVPNVSNSKLFAFYRYNSKLNSEYVSAYGDEQLKTYFTTKVLDDNANEIATVNNVGNQLGGKLYILTGPYTASASEQIINGLKPYMNVILIGDTTYGKNVASTTFYDEKNTSKNKWGMQPIIAKYFNSLGKSDFTAGFAPNYVVRDGGLDMKEFGDPSEPLLNTALNHIVGSQAFPLAKKRAASIRTDRLLRVPGKRIRGMQLDKMPFFE